METVLCWTRLLRLLLPPPLGQARPAIKVVRFSRLKAELKKATAEMQAVVSAEVTAGRPIVTNLPPRIANKLTGANRDKAKAARALPPTERADVACATRPVTVAAE